MHPLDPLSPRQRQLVNTIEQLTSERGYPPTLAEVAAAMKLHPSRIGQLAASTESKGWLRREPRVARSWRIVKPDAPAAAPGR